MSAASTWELAVKTLLRKVVLPDDFHVRLASAGLRELPVTVQHTWDVRDPTGLAHHDPVDRLLVAQARSEGLTFLTADTAILNCAQPHVRSARE